MIDPRVLLVLQDGASDLSDGLLHFLGRSEVHDHAADCVRFVDGKLTAGMAAAKVKQNEEMAQDPDKLQLLYRIA